MAILSFRSFRPESVLAAVGFAGWLVLTAACHHPDRSFDRLRDWHPSHVVIPEWRFFAPEPGRQDYHVVYRVLAANGGQHPWQSATVFAERSWMDLFWLPDRRRDKAVFDICNSVRVLVAGDNSARLTQAAPYLLLRDFVAAVARRDHADGEPLLGFQFAIVMFTGYDEEHEPEYLMVSPFVPMGG